MDQPYSAWADWLSKFHTWPELIQALWLIAIPVTVLGIAWLLMRGLRDLIPTLARRHWCGHLVYGVYQDAQGRWKVYWHGRKPEAVDWTNRHPNSSGEGRWCRACSADRRGEEE